MGFEYRDAWIAVRSESIDDVLTALNSRSLRDCKWSEGAAQSPSTASRTSNARVQYSAELKTLVEAASTLALTINVVESARLAIGKASP